MLSCGPGARRAASGASPVKFGVNVGPGGLPPTSVQIGAVVHWLLTRPISESVTADRSSVITRRRQPCAMPYQRRSPSRSRVAPAVVPSRDGGRDRPRGTGAGERLSPGWRVGRAGGKTVTSIVPMETRAEPGPPGGCWRDPNRSGPASSSGRGARAGCEAGEGGRPRPPEPAQFPDRVAAAGRWLRTGAAGLALVDARRGRSRPPGRRRGSHPGRRRSGSGPGRRCGRGRGLGAGPAGRRWPTCRIRQLDGCCPWRADSGGSRRPATRRGGWGHRAVCRGHWASRGQRLPRLGAGARGRRRRPGSGRGASWLSRCGDRRAEGDRRRPGPVRLGWRRRTAGGARADGGTGRRGDVSGPVLRPIPLGCGRAAPRSDQRRGWLLTGGQPGRGGRGETARGGVPGASWRGIRGVFARLPAVRQAGGTREEGTRGLQRRRPGGTTGQSGQVRHLGRHGTHRPSSATDA